MLQKLSFFFLCFSFGERLRENDNIFVVLVFLRCFTEELMDFFKYCAGVPSTVLIFYEVFIFFGSFLQRNLMYGCFKYGVTISSLIEKPRRSWRGNKMCSISFLPNTNKLMKEISP